MATFLTANEAKADRLLTASGQCECADSRCHAPTHKVYTSRSELTVGITRCSSPTSISEPIDPACVRVIRKHPQDELIDSTRLRVYCVRCAENHENAMGFCTIWI